jgi:hypothetical protein
MANKFFGIVELFPQDKGWFYVRAPQKISQPYAKLADRGLIAVTAAVGKSTWNTSFLPYGDGTHFIALPAKVRTKEKIALGDRIEVNFSIRKRTKK